MSEIEKRKTKDQKRSPPSVGGKSIADALQKAIDLGILTAAEKEAERKFFHSEPPWND